MMVLVLTACPVGLRGDLTKWLSEISPGVFVGRPSSRVRDLLWERSTELCKDGRVILVHTADNEQGLEYRVHNHDWTPIDLDGLTVMLRPTAPPDTARRGGWSIPRAQRRARRPGWRRGGADAGSSG